MRIVSTILSLYFLGLAVLPCTDGATNSADLAMEQILAGHSHDGHEHPAGEDLCSPFCICTCCNTPVVEVPAFVLQAFSPVENPLNQNYKERLTAAFPSSLFQPPQV